MEKLTGRKKTIAKQSENLTGIQKNLILQTVPSENGHRSNLYNKNQLILISICHKVKNIKNMTIKTMKNQQKVSLVPKSIKNVMCSFTHIYNTFE